MWITLLKIKNPITYLKDLDLKNLLQINQQKHWKYIRILHCK